MEKILADIFNSNILIIIFLFIYIIILYFISRKNDSKLISSDEYLVLRTSIEQEIEIYKSEILDPRIRSLNENLDLDTNSQTNAQKLYNDTYNEIIQHACKDFLKNYLSDYQRHISYKYFTGDGLSLYVFSKLKGNN